MRKIIKKALAGIMALAMVVGFGTSVSAAEGKDVTVTVIWEAAEGQEVYLHCWGTQKYPDWPGQKMTANADGTFTIVLKNVTDDTINVIPDFKKDGNTTQTANIENISTSTGFITVTVTTETNSNGHFLATAEATADPSASTGSDTATGDVSHLPLFLAAGIAVLGATLSVATKKKAQAE